MGDVWQAYQFIQRSADVGRVGPDLTQMAAAETTMKSFLAQRQGIAGSFDEVNANYEIRMELVRRQQAVSDEALNMSNAIARQLGL